MQEHNDSTCHAHDKLGLMDAATYEKITMRHLGPDKIPEAAPMTREEIGAVRERAHMSQAVPARHLNLIVEPAQGVADRVRSARSTPALRCACPAKAGPGRRDSSPASPRLRRSRLFVSVPRALHGGGWS